MSADSGRISPTSLLRENGKSSFGMDENLAALLSYVFGWVTGLIFDLTSNYQWAFVMLASAGLCATLLALALKRMGDRFG